MGAGLQSRPLLFLITTEPFKMALHPLEPGMRGTWNLMMGTKEVILDLFKHDGTWIAAIPLSAIPENCRGGLTALAEHIAKEHTQ